MEDQCDEANMLGQMAGIIAMLSALVKVLPSSTRRRLLDQTQVEFESLLAAMSAAGPSQVQMERESVEWMRDLFLRNVQQADAKPARRRIRKASGGAAPGKGPDAAQRPASTNVDLEL